MVDDECRWSKGSEYDEDKWSVLALFYRVRFEKSVPGIIL